MSAKILLMSSYLPLVNLNAHEQKSCRTILVHRKGQRNYQCGRDSAFFTQEPPYAKVLLGLVYVVVAEGFGENGLFCGRGLIQKIELAWSFLGL